MTGVEIDADARPARAQAGALWNDVVGAATEQGLTGLHGSSGGRRRRRLHARRRTRLAGAQARLRLPTP